MVGVEAHYRTFCMSKIGAHYAKVGRPNLVGTAGRQRRMSAFEDMLSMNSGS